MHLKRFSDTLPLRKMQIGESHTPAPANEDVSECGFCEQAEALEGNLSTLMTHTHAHMVVLNNIQCFWRMRN